MLTHLLACLLTYFLTNYLLDLRRGRCDLDQARWAGHAPLPRLAGVLLLTPTLTLTLPPARTRTRTRNSGQVSSYFDLLRTLTLTLTLNSTLPLPLPPTRNPRPGLRLPLAYLDLLDLPSGSPLP